jgi:hypothetical protein
MSALSSSRDPQERSHGVEMIQSAGGRAVAVAGDVREEETALRAMLAAKEHFGAWWGLRMK